MNELFRTEVYNILSDEFSKKSVLLEYPFHKTVDGFILLDPSEYKNSCIDQIKECLNNKLDKKKLKYIGVILPVTYNDVNEQVDDLRESVLNIAVEVVNSISEEIDIECMHNLTGDLMYEDIIYRLKMSCKNRKQIGTYAKSIEALYLYGFSFKDKCK